ncbi:PQQ-binding-like beta-propeller repeat protein [Planctomycetota bacterium]
MYKFEKRTGTLIWKLTGGGSDSGVTIGFDGKLILPMLGHSCIDAETREVLWKPELRGTKNCTAAYHNRKIFLSSAGHLVALDADNGHIDWAYEGAGGLTAAVVGNNGYVYCGSINNPYFYALNEKGNSDGTTDCLFRIIIEGGLLEATPALYRGKAYVLSAGGYYCAIE